MTEEVVDFSPRNDPPTLKRFAKDNSWIRVVVGPVGSGKSTRCVRELARRALRQKPGADGVRRSRFAVIRNTYSQLRDTTRKTFEQWIPAWMGTWHEQSFTFTISMDLDDGTRVHSEILFRALDRPEDVRKLLSLELTGAYINELREIPERILEVLETRVSRFPSKMQGGPSWSGIWADTNPWHGGHWGAKRFAKGLAGHALFRQPSGRSPQAENKDKLPDPNYYDRLCVGHNLEWIRVYVDGEDADSDVGSVYGAWIADLRQRGGICAFDHPTNEIHTAWDLGRSDSTAVWFWRYNSKRLPQIVDHYENAGQGPSHYFDVLDKKGYQYAKFFLPHDARARTFATQQTVEEQFFAKWGSGRVVVLPQMPVADGIAAARWLLEQQIEIHERCEAAARLEHSGVEALTEYRYEWDEENQCFSTNPLHNWASHTADAFRELAVVVRYAEKLTRPPPPKEDALAKLSKPPTLDELWAMQPKPSGRI